jgi:hypothetical protein
MKSKLEPEIKCAPSKKYKDGSCFTLESLKIIAENYNKKNKKNKIDINQDKANIVEQLEKKLSDKCSEQTCWLRLDIVKELENEEIDSNTFRPKGPSKKYDWLSTTNINDVIEQYQAMHDDFVFLGAVPVDFEDLPVLGIANINLNEFKADGKTKIGMVINLDEHYKDGSHWVAFYTDLIKNQVYFFDSVGKPPVKRIRKFINRITKHLYMQKYNKNLPVNDIIKKLKTINKEPSTKVHISNEYIKNLLGGGFDIRYNNIQHQFNNSECGVYSVNFIIRLLEGESFDSIINNITKDDKMNANRKIYFRNVN